MSPSDTGFFAPDITGMDLGTKLYDKVPWTIYRKGDSWIYLGTSPGIDVRDYHLMAVFNEDYSKGTIYHRETENFKRGNIHALTFFPTDQILISQLLPFRNGCYLHAAGLILNGKGLLFVGHSEAGKSTMVKMLRERAEILCDDRIVVRKNEQGYHIHGTWSHGEVPRRFRERSPAGRDFSSFESPWENRLVPVADKKEILSTLLSCLIKPMVTTGWWQSMLSLVEDIGQECPML